MNTSGTLQTDKEKEQNDSKERGTGFGNGGRMKNEEREMKRQIKSFLRRS